VADTNCRFVYVDIGSYGDNCDSPVFLKIYAMDINSDKELQLPSERSLSVTEGLNVKYFFVVDERLALNRNILRQFG